MKKLLKKPEILLIALALVFFACAVLVGYFTQFSSQGSSVIYVSDKEKEKLLQNGTYESVIINLNTATKEELCSLEGISTILADAIIDYRDENGGFKSIDEIKNINGIGDKKYENIQPYVTVE